MRHSMDRILLILIIVLVLFGFLIFSSASLGLLARGGARFSSVALNQAFFGILGGGIAFFLTSTIHYRWWRQYAFYIFIVTLIATFAVFIPGLRFEHGGARRWIAIGSFTMQPSELLKIVFVIYMATWLSGMKHAVKSFTYGTLPFLGFLLGAAILLLLQPESPGS